MRSLAGTLTLLLWRRGSNGQETLSVCHGNSCEIRYFVESGGIDVPPMECAGRELRQSRTEGVHLMGCRLQRKFLVDRRTLFALQHRLELIEFTVRQ